MAFEALIPQGYQLGDIANASFVYIYHKGKYALQPISALNQARKYLLEFMKLQNLYSAKIDKYGNIAGLMDNKTKKEITLKIPLNVSAWANNGKPYLSVGSVVVLFLNKIK